MMAETKKMLDPKIKVTCTAVRVPVFIGHFGSRQHRIRKPITADEARDILRDAPGCLVIDKREDGGYITPLESAGEDATYISRIREDQNDRERPEHLGGVGQPAQGRGAQRGPDRRAARRARAHPAQAARGLTTPQRNSADGRRTKKGGREAALLRFGCCCPVTRGFRGTAAGR